MENEWSQLVGEVIAEFTASADETERAIGALRETQDYNTAHSLWLHGMKHKEAKRWIRNLLEEIGYEQSRDRG